MINEGAVLYLDIKKIKTIVNFKQILCKNVVGETKGGFLYVESGKFEL
jgi:hypothetical protein